jgi:hypothetical protein
MHNRSLFSINCDSDWVALVLIGDYLLRPESIIGLKRCTMIHSPLSVDSLRLCLRNESQLLDSPVLVVSHILKIVIKSDFVSDFYIGFMEFLSLTIAILQWIHGGLSQNPDFLKIWNHTWKCSLTLESTLGLRPASFFIGCQTVLQRFVWVFCGPI